MKKSILIFMGVFALVFNAKAQDGFENILFADLSDANELTKGYLTPAAEALIFGMSNGWYHTAKVHKPFGFDIAIGGNFSFAGDNQNNFDINSLKLSNKITKNPSTSPTIFGKGAAAVNAFEVTIPANSDPNINGGTHPELKRNFTMPDGYRDELPLNSVPTPVVQLSLGLPAKFEATLRFVPNVGSNETKANLFGLGLKKEITDWFGPMDKTPLHISLLGAFTNMTISHNIKDPNGNDINITNGLAELKLNSYTFQALASLNFPIINLYGGVGYTSGSSTLRLAGEYDLQYSDGINNYNRTLKDPLTLDYDASGFTTTVGARLSLGFFKIFGAYTLQQYNTATLGVAISIR
ncbi:hypothetical protein JL193_04840 [Polaribacter batillariae]|uniref:Outer membrane protein beta-barrel domain-containing protein n=1 Tax=Polaribacter batillariae TaxID=2808900 RepID=A0ABX7T0J9_9FLAO|nr:DUF6588 family protein [Polaribacter batillariae]QTD38608.1 hypothetical protein JL193_04840 [Polaribacter batillariae]